MPSQHLCIHDIVYLYREYCSICGVATTYPERVWKILAAAACVATTDTDSQTFQYKKWLLGRKLTVRFIYHLPCLR